MKTNRIYLQILILSFLFLNKLNAQELFRTSNVTDCKRFVSTIEDPTNAQIAGGTLPSIVSSINWYRPALSTAKGSFSGTNGSAAGHEGVDYIYSNQSVVEVVVRAAADAKVVYVREGCDQSSMFEHNNITREAGAGWGNHIVLMHKDVVYTRYGHLLKNSIIVNNGDSVKAGQIIAVMGNSGRSELRHLHFELGTKSTAFDPCGTAQNFDRVYDSEKLNYINSNGQVILNSPTDGSQNVSTNPYLSWEKDAGSNLYQLEIAKDASFNNIIKTVSTTDNFYAFENLSIGANYWRVKSNSLNYSAAWSFSASATESFEHCPVNGLPTGWKSFAENVSKGTVTNNNAWVATNIDKKNTGNYSARMGNYQTVSDCWMVTPAIQVNTNTVPLSFFWANTAGDYDSKLEVYISESTTQPSSAAQFNLIKTISEGPDALWHKESLSLSAYSGKTIFVGFKVHNFGSPTDVNAGGDNWWIDDLTLSDKVSTGFTNIENFMNNISITPNPVINNFELNLYLSKESNLNVDLIDLSGRRISNLFTGAVNDGNSNLKLNISDSNTDVAAGIYFLKITAENYSKSVKIVVSN